LSGPAPPKGTDMSEDVNVQPPPQPEKPKSAPIRLLIADPRQLHTGANVRVAFIQPDGVALYPGNFTVREIRTNGRLVLKHQIPRQKKIARR